MAADCQCLPPKQAARACVCVCVSSVCVAPALPCRLMLAAPAPRCPLHCSFYCPFYVVH